MLAKEGPESHDKLPRFVDTLHWDISSLFKLDSKVHINMRRISANYNNMQEVQNIIDKVLRVNPNYNIGAKRTALTRLFVLLEDDVTRAAFLESRGMALLKDLMENCLTESIVESPLDLLPLVLQVFKTLIIHDPNLR